MATVAVVAVSFWLEISRFEWLAIIMAIGLVWVAELMNTVAETIVNLSSPDKHPLARIAKDLAAATVLVTAIVAVLIGLIVLGLPLLSKLGITL